MSRQFIRCWPNQAEHHLAWRYEAQRYRVQRHDAKATMAVRVVARRKADARRSITPLSVLVPALWKTQPVENSNQLGSQSWPRPAWLQSSVAMCGYSSLA